MGKRKCKITFKERTLSDDGHFYHKDKIEYGLFHEFGKDFDEFENGAVEFTVAIVELSDGRIKMIRADAVQFIPQDFEMPGWNKWVY